MEGRVEALDKARRELEDSFMVMAQLETRMSQPWFNTRDGWSGTKSMAESDERMRRIETKMEEMTVKISEMTGKVDFLINREMARRWA